MKPLGEIIQDSQKRTVTRLLYGFGVFLTLAFLVTATLVVVSLNDRIKEAIDHIERELLVSQNLSMTAKHILLEICEFSSCNELVVSDKHSTRVLHTVPDLALDGQMILLHRLRPVFYNVYMLENLRGFVLTFEGPNIIVFLMLEYWPLLQWPIVILFSLLLVTLGFIFATRLTVRRSSDLLQQEIKALVSHIDSPGIDDPIKDIVTQEIHKVMIFIEEQTGKIASFEREFAKLIAEKEVASLAKRVAHDIRAPLSALKVAVTSNNHGRDEDNEDKVRLISHAVARIESIANDLLQTSRRKNFSSLVEIIKAIEELIEEKRLTWKDCRAIEFRSSIINHNSIYKIEVNRLVSILSNLLENSFEATSPTIGQIRISLKCPDQNLLISVEDNGHGIPSSIMDKVGTEGFTTKARRGSGNGIGLFSGKQTIEEMGGALTIKSSGNGTCVTIRLPTMGN